MKQVVVGGLEQSAINIITEYFEPLYDSLEFKVLGTSGLAGIVSRAINTPDVILIALDVDTYNSLIPKVKTLGHAKVFKYISDDDLEAFCQKMIGVKPKAEPIIETKEEDSFNKPVVPDEDTDLPDLTPIVEETDLSDQNFSEVDNSETEAIISRLNDDIIQKDMIIRNLEQQIREIESGSSDDEKEFIAEIRRLNSELDEAKMKLESAETVSSELDYNARAKIEFAEKKIAELNELKSKIDEYEITISGYKKQLSDLTDENQSLSSQINDFSDEINDLNSSVSEYKTQLEAKGLEIDGKDEEIVLLQNKLSELDTLKLSLEEAESRINDLTLQIQNKDIDIQGLTDKIESLKSIIDEEKSKFEDLVVENTSLNEKINILEGLMTSKDSEISDNLEKINSLNETISSLNEEKELLSADLDKANTSLESKLDEIELIKERMSELRGKANNSAEVSEELKKALQEQEDALRQKEEEFKVKYEEFDAQKLQFESEKQALEKEKLEAINSSQSTSDALNKLLAEKQTLEDKLVEVTETNLNLDSEITRLTNAIESKDSDISSRDERISELEAESNKSQNLITSLQTQIVNNKSTNDHVTQLENELLEEKRKVSNLASELDIMKKIDDSGKVADLKIEVAQLKHKLNEKTEVDSELQKLRQRCASLEIQLAKSKSKSSASGVFAQMSNIAQPKLAYDCKASEVTGLANNFICIASGSTESTSPTYQLIRKTCQANPNKRCLIVDLSTDSYIDREFATEKVISPIEWLQGSQPFTNYTSRTKFNNVKVISTGLAYLNDLYFLQTDWQNRLSELQGFADVVILYIGCLNNAVTKILFNTFNSCMRSFVITKATPINLRTVILTMTGFVNLNSSLTTIGCVNFDANTSKSLYQKLASKYNAQIYSDSDVIAI